MAIRLAVAEAEAEEAALLAVVVAALLEAVVVAALLEAAVAAGRLEAAAAVVGPLVAAAAVLHRVDSSRRHPSGVTIMPS